MRETCGGGICSMDDWIDNQEACMFMNVSPEKLLQLGEAGLSPYSHIDRKVYYRRQDIIRYLENSIHHVTPESYDSIHTDQRKPLRLYVFSEHKHPVQNAG